MNILVIGGTGFIGGHVVRYLGGTGHDVAVLSRGLTPASLPPAVRHIRGDRQQLPARAAEFRRLAPDVVLDIIAYSEQDAEALTATFRGVARRLVVVSSMDVYAAYGRLRRSEGGGPDAAPLAEDAPLRVEWYPYRAAAKSPSDLAYSYDKLAVEQAVMNDRELRGCVLRLPKVYGPGDRQHHTFDYLRRMEDGRPFILLNETKARWRWTRGYVENVAAAVALATTDGRAAGRIYNVGEESALTEAEWVQGIGRAAGWQGEVVAVPGRMLPGHLAEDYDYRHHLAADTSRIRKELGYVEPVTHAEGLTRTVSWERAHPLEDKNVGPLDYAAEDAVLKTLGLI